MKLVPLELLSCVVCRSSMPLFQNGSSLQCPNCKSSYPVRDGKFFFTSIELNTKESFSARDSHLSLLKEKVKNNFPKLYPSLIELLSPVMNNFSVQKFLEKRSRHGWTLNLGSGVTDLGPQVINVDMMAYPTVNVIANLEKLPFQTASVDTIVNVAVLEHVPNPYLATAEMLRVLKPQGVVISFVPFMQGQHSSPHDYRRFTPQGLQKLFAGFTIDHIRSGGPASALVWILQEFLAMFFSFGSMKLYRVIHFLLMALAPLKYFDVLMQHHPAASQIANGFWIEAHKPATVVDQTSKN